MTAHRFTAIADPVVDRLIAAHLEVVRDSIRREVPPAALAGIALFGGYGRGEGGVAYHRGEGRPHNNYDLLVVLKRDSRWHSARLAGRLRALGTELEPRLGVGVDVSTIEQHALGRVPPQIFWFDMRRMHRIVDGPGDLLAAIPAYSIDQIPQEEKARLLLNRSALLAINRLIWRVCSGRPTEGQHHAMIKHTAKAILGFGDAVLLAGGRYVVSYRRKVRALADTASTSEWVSQRFTELHRWATEFRFQPRYNELTVADLERLMDNALREGRRIHHGFESRRLGGLSTDWADYLDRFERLDPDRSRPEASQRQRAGDLTMVVRRLAGASQRVLQNIRAFGRAGLPALRNVGWLLRAPFLRVMATAPAALYLDVEPTYRREAARLIGCGAADLLPAFVDAWARVLDPNAGPVLAALGIG